MLKYKIPQIVTLTHSFHNSAVRLDLDKKEVMSKAFYPFGITSYY